MRSPENGEGLPGWITVVGGIALIVVLVVVAMLLAGGSGHVPVRH